MNISTMKKELIKASQNIAGLSDDEIKSAHAALSPSSEPSQPLAPTPKPSSQKPVGALEEAIASIIDSRLEGFDPTQQVSTDDLVKLIKEHATQQHEVIITKDSKIVNTITGAHYAMSDVATYLEVDNVYMVGPSGSGKTTLAHQVADALGLDYYFTGAVLQKYELVGFVDAAGKYHSTAFREAFEKGGVFLADEMDAFSPEALVAINAATANGSYTFPDSPKPLAKHEDFKFIGAANTIGTGANRQYVGRNPLDAATLDRFLQIEIDYDPAIELAMAQGNTKWLKEVQETRARLNELGIHVVVSPRATRQGAALLAKGIKIEQVRKATIHKHLTADQIGQLKG